MRLPDQLRRSPTFDIRSAVHTGIDFDINGHFTPLFKGIVYLMVPQWANISSVDDLKKVKMNVAGHEIDLVNLDLSRIDHSKLKFHSDTNEKSEKPKVEQVENNNISNETKSWFTRWFSSEPTPTSTTSSSPPLPSQSSVSPSTTSATPLTRKFSSSYLIRKKLINMCVI